MVVAPPSYATRLRGSIRRNLEHFQLFGPAIMLRHFRTKQAVHKVHMAGVGAIHIRIDGSDVSTFKQVFIKREYDFAGLGPSIDRVRRRFDAIIASGSVPVIVDAGANVGAATLWFCQQFPGAAIVAIEPEPLNAAILRLNTQMQADVTVIEAAIAATRGTISIPAGSTGWDVQTERSAGGAIAAITVQDAIGSVPRGVPFIAKIDIEGFESDLFSENVAWLDEMAMVLIEPHDWMFPGQFTSTNFQREMGVRSFELFINGENLIYVARF